MQLRELDPQYDSESDNKEDEEPEEIEESQSIEEPGKKPYNIPPSRKDSQRAAAV